MNGYVSNKSSVSLNDECTLITEDYSTDDNGIQQPQAEIKETTVYCGRFSTAREEFYKAQQQGAKIDLALAVITEEFNGQTMVIFNKRQYVIYRTFERSDGMIELYCTEKVGKP